MYVRFKFSTSEFERLQLPMRRREDSSHDDSYSVTVRSDKGDVASKTGSVMRSTFNFYGTDYRSTDWILLRLPLTPGSTKAQIVMTVQNKGDSSYDSALIIDKAGLEQEGTCKYVECHLYLDEAGIANALSGLHVQSQSMVLAASIATAWRARSRAAVIPPILRWELARRIAMRTRRAYDTASVVLARPLPEVSHNAYRKRSCEYRDRD